MSKKESAKLGGKKPTGITTEREGLKFKNFGKKIKVDKS